MVSVFRCVPCGINCKYSIYLQNYMQQQKHEIYLGQKKKHSTIMDIKIHIYAQCNPQTTIRRMRNNF